MSPLLASVIRVRRCSSRAAPVRTRERTPFALARLQMGGIAPSPHHAIAGAGGDQAALWGTGHREDFAGVLEFRDQLGAPASVFFVHIPHFDRAWAIPVATTREE